MEWMLRAFKTVFHHELFHMLDWVYAARRDDEAGYDDHEWKAIHQQFGDTFTYDTDQDTTTAYQDDLALYSLELGTGSRGFANSYQRSAVWEDKACLFAYLHTDQSSLLQMCVLDSILNAKVCRLFEICADIDEALNEDFFVNLTQFEYS